jgi:hypothetical protein
MAVGAILVVLGLIGVIFGVVALIDPAGSKMADDGAPFGSPLGVMESLLITAAYAVAAMLGCWMLLAQRRKHDT